MEKTPAVDSSLEDFKRLSVVDEATVQTKSSSVEACFHSFLDRSKDDIQVELMNFSKQDQDLIRDPLSLTSSKAADIKGPFGLSLFLLKLKIEIENTVIK